VAFVDDLGARHDGVGFGMLMPPAAGAGAAALGAALRGTGRRRSASFDFRNDKMPT